MAYLPNSDSDRAEMLDALGLKSQADLFRTVPRQLLDPPMELPPPLSELELAQEMRRLAGANRPLSQWDCFLGAGIYSRFIPAVVAATIGRPEFYTAYTPYQAEASQGYLQTIFEFQSMVAELYDLDLANASMYDVATATAEGALMATTHTGRDRVVAASSLHPEILAVLRTYAEGRGAKLELVATRAGTTDLEAARSLLDDEVAVLVLPQPNFLGLVEPAADLVALAHGVGALALVVADPIAAAVLEPPGAVGADLAAGDGQQLGIPPQLGGPTVGLLACRQELMRRIPGRLVGLTADVRGQRAFCLTLQTREQHIRRERASSNICTNHALMGLAATAYMARMGGEGMAAVADISYRRAHALAEGLAGIPGLSLRYPGVPFLWEFVLECPGSGEDWAQQLAERGILAGYPLGRLDPALERCLLVCATETSSPAAVARYLEAARELAGRAAAVGAAR